MDQTMSMLRCGKRKVVRMRTGGCTTQKIEKSVLPTYSEPKAASAIQTYGTRRTPQHKLSVPTAHLKEAVPMRTMAKARC